MTESTAPEQRPTRPLGPKVYVVCDQPDTGAVWGYLLRQKGVTVFMQTSVERAIEDWYTHTMDLIVIDVKAPANERRDLCRKLREVSVCPILLLLPSQNENEVLDAYDIGVDDCIVKPVSPALFSAKVMSWARRSWMLPVESVRPIQTKHWSLDPRKHTLHRSDGAVFPLTNLEVRLLTPMMSQSARVLTIEELLRAAWGSYAVGDEKPLRNVMHRLRKKIGFSGRNAGPIQTSRGGYAFVDN